MFFVNAQKFPIWWNMMECHVHQRSWWDTERSCCYIGKISGLIWLGDPFPNQFWNINKWNLNFFKHQPSQWGLICRGESYAMNSTVLEKRGGIILFLGVWNGPILSCSERKSCDPPMLGGLVVAMTWKKTIDVFFSQPKLDGLTPGQNSTLPYNLRRTATM